MNFARSRFNLILLIVPLLLSGCGSFQSKKPRPILALHLETPSQMPQGFTKAPIYRANPVIINVEKGSFLSELNLVRAEIKDWSGAFAIELEFDSHGTRVLEVMTVSNRGKRIAVMGGVEAPRWLGAQTIGKHISDGKFSFFPDATREEAGRWVSSLNEQARKQNKRAL